MCDVYMCGVCMHVWGVCVVSGMVCVVFCGYGVYVYVMCVCGVWCVCMWYGVCGMCVCGVLCVYTHAKEKEKHYGEGGRGRSELVENSTDSSC